MTRSAFMPDGRRTTAATALPAVLQSEAGGLSIPDGCDAAILAPGDDYAIPARLLKRIRAGRHKFPSPMAELWGTAAALHPPRAPVKAVTVHWIVDAALNVAGGDVERAARAIRRVHRSGFEIGRDTLEHVLRATGVLRGP